MANVSEKYPAISYDREPGGWEVTSESISQIDIPGKLAHAESYDLPWFSGPLNRQLSDGTNGPEDGAVSVVWGSAERPDGTRTVLGWYESSR